MKQPTKFVPILALAFVTLGILLAVAFIIGIWTGFASAIIGKSIATIFVLFLLNGVLYSVAKGIDEKPKNKE